MFLIASHFYYEISDENFIISVAPILLQPTREDFFLNETKFFGLCSSGRSSWLGRGRYECACADSPVPITDVLYPLKPTGTMQIWKSVSDTGIWVSFKKPELHFFLRRLCGNCSRVQIKEKSFTKYFTWYARKPFWTLHLAQNCQNSLVCLLLEREKKI